MYAVIIKGPEEDTDEAIEEFQDEMNDLTEKLEKLTDGKYAVGQDDDQMFFACADDDFLSSLFPHQDILEINMDDYPWDYNEI